MEIVLIEKIDLKKRHIKVLEEMGKGNRFGWSRGIMGRVLDELHGNGLITFDQGYGAELFHITAKGRSALVKINEIKTSLDNQK